MSYSHQCIKCKSTYEDSDPEPFYCPDCNEVRKAIAAEVDKKMTFTQSKRPIRSALQEYDASQKVHGFVQVHL